MSCSRPGRLGKKPGARSWIASAALLAALSAGATEVSFLFAYDPGHPEDPSTRCIIELARKNPDLVPVRWGGLRLPGGGGRATFMLSLAAQSAPDVYKAWFHILRHDIGQGFVYPLDEWIDPASVAGSGDLWDRVRCCDGHVWALPTPAVAYYGIVYRRDLVALAGLDPDSPPKTWSEFRDWCVKLTRPGCRAFAVENRPWGFLPWVQSAGGDVVRERGRGKRQLQNQFCDATSGRAVSTKPPQTAASSMPPYRVLQLPRKSEEGNGEREWEACFDSPAAVRAAEYLKSLRKLDVIRALPTLTLEDDIGRLFASGEIVAVFGGEDLVRRLTEVQGVAPETIGIMPFPAADGEGGVRVVQAHRHFYAMSETAGRRPKDERDLIFSCLQALASRDVADAEVRRNVAEGRAQWCRPADLRRLGFEDEIAKFPKSLLDMYEGLENGTVKAVTEPWVGFWQGASDLVQRRFLGLLLSDAVGELDCAAALKSINDDANRGLMFESDRSRLDRARPYARAILGVVFACALVSAFLVWRSRGGAASADLSRDSARAAHRFAPWLFLLPAVASILLWSYYPLIRGAVMAFQDYRIVGDAKWAGLDNFIRVATDPGFWASWGRTLKYVFISLLLGFLAPVLLALMLCEIPRGKVFFRFLYFLPHLTSALVVTLLWKLMFDPTENGILNQLLMSVGCHPRTWLLDPSMAMTCCILPGVWAGAGISSLIYIAALESLPRDYYEAAAIDGAGILARFRHITLPQLAPLMVINFVGAFIAAFQGMGSIFLLTFGGPGDATQVVSLQIWKEAYNNLRFSTATTMAWFLGVALIAFTYLQIRLLRRVEFRRAAAN